MDNLITDELIEKTFLFCWKKMADKEDARDLAQEIVVNAMLILRSGKKIDNFYGLYWQIARNKIADFYRKKRPVKISLDDMKNSLLGFDKSIGDFITQEELDNLAHSMNRLDSIYRDILVRFYIKEQSINEIASELEIPAGTVKGRLFDARKKLKENFETMENDKIEPEKKKTKAVDFKLSWYGTCWESYYAVSSLLDKQILFLCRKEEKSIKQLSKEIDAAPVFIEDNIRKLCNANVLFENSKGKYLTDFPIFPASAVRENDEKAKQIADKSNLAERYFEILLGMKDELLNEDFYGKDLDWNYLLPYFIIRSDRELYKTIGHDYIRNKYAKSKYDRFWRHGFLSAKYEDVPDYKNDGKKQIIGPGYRFNSFVSAKYGRCEIHNTISMMDAKINGKDVCLDMDRQDFLNPSNVDLYREITENPLKQLNEKEEVAVADLISKGAIEKTKDGFKGKIPVIRFETIDRWCKSWNEKFKSLGEEYYEAIYQIGKNTLLPYIRKDLLWASMCFFFPSGVDIDSYLMQYAIDHKLVHFEEGHNASCTAIVLLKE